RHARSEGGRAVQARDPARGRRHHFRRPQAVTPAYFLIIAYTPRDTASNRFRSLMSVWLTMPRKLGLELLYPVALTASTMSLTDRPLGCFSSTSSRTEARLLGLRTRPLLVWLLALPLKPPTAPPERLAIWRS